MGWIWVSTMVDDALLAEARRLLGNVPDAAVLDESMKHLVHHLGDEEIGRKYARAYAAHPCDEPDAWGDIVSWSDAAKLASAASSTTE